MCNIRNAGEKEKEGKLLKQAEMIKTNRIKTSLVCLTIERLNPDKTLIINK